MFFFSRNLAILQVRYEKFFRQLLSMDGNYVSTKKKFLLFSIFNRIHVETQICVECETNL